MRLALAHMGAALVALTTVVGCAAPASERPAAEASANTNSGGGGDWSKFEGGRAPVDPRNARTVPESAIEITGVPFVRGVRLSWSAGDEVPSFEPDNQTLKLPGTARQAVLAVAVVDLPNDAGIRVDWYFGDQLVFDDRLGSREDGDHFFALVKREGRRLEALPKGQYHADVYAGDKLVKTVRFEVGA